MSQNPDSNTTTTTSATISRASEEASFGEGVQLQEQHSPSASPLLLTRVELSHNFSGSKRGASVFVDRNETIWGERSVLSRRSAAKEQNPPLLYRHHSTARHGNAIASDICDGVNKMTKRQSSKYVRRQQSEDLTHYNSDSTASSCDTGSSASLGSTHRLKRSVQLKRLSNVVKKANQIYLNQFGEPSSEEDQQSISAFENTGDTNAYSKSNPQHRHFLRRTRAVPFRKDSNVAKEDRKAFQEICRMTRQGDLSDLSKKESSTESSASEFSVTHAHHHHPQLLKWDSAAERWAREHDRILPTVSNSSSFLFRYVYPQRVIFCRSAQHIFLTTVVIVLISFLAVPIVSLRLAYQQVVSTQDALLATCVFDPLRSALHLSNLNQLVSLLTLFAVYGGSNASLRIPLDSTQFEAFSPAAFLTATRFLSPSDVNKVFISSATRPINVSQLFPNLPNWIPRIAEGEFDFGGSERSISNIVDSLVSSVNSNSQSVDRLRTEMVLFVWSRYLLNPRKVNVLAGYSMTFEREVHKLAQHHSSVRSLLSRSIGKSSIRSREEYESVVNFVFESVDPPSGSSESKNNFRSVDNAIVDVVEAWVSRHSTELLAISNGRGVDGELRKSLPSGQTSFTRSRAGRSLRMLGNLVNSRIEAIQQRQLLFGELVATPSGSANQYLVTSVFQPASSVTTRTNISNLTTVSLDTAPLGKDTPAYVSTLDFSFARIFFDVVPVMTIVSQNNSNRSAPFIYTDDLFTSDGSTEQVLYLPDLQSSARNFLADGAVPISQPNAVYSASSIASLSYVNGFYQQLTREGPLGSLSFSLLLSFQREVIRSLNSVEALRQTTQLDSVRCSESLLYRVILKLSSELFEEVVSRSAKLLSKVGDGIPGTYSSLDLSFQNNDDDVNYVLHRSAFGVTSRCLSSSTRGESMGLSACNLELWRRYGLMPRNTTADSVSTSHYFKKIEASKRDVRSKVVRLLKALALLRYDMKVIVADERLLHLSDASLDLFLNGNVSFSLSAARPLASASASHLLFVRSASVSWVSKAIALTKGLGILASQIGSYELRVDSSLAFGAQSRFSGFTDNVMDIDRTDAPLADAILWGKGRSRQSRLMSAMNADGKSSRKAVDLLFSMRSLSSLFSGRDTEEISMEMLEDEDVSVLLNLQSRNFGSGTSGVSAPLDAGNSISDSLAMLFERRSEDSPWFDVKNDDSRGLMALLTMSRGFLEWHFNSQIRQAKEVSQAATETNGLVGFLTATRGDTDTLSDVGDSYEKYAGLNPLYPQHPSRVLSKESNSTINDAGLQIIVWSDQFAEKVIIVCAVFLAGVIPLVAIVWGLWGISLKLNKSYLRYRYLVLFFVMLVWSTCAILGGVIAYLNIAMLRSQGMSALDGSDGLASQGRLEKFLQSPISLQSNSSGSVSDYLLNTQLFHYFKAETSSFHSGRPTSLPGFLEVYLQTTLFPLLHLMHEVTNETANAALLIGGVVNPSEVVSVIEQRLQISNKDYSELSHQREFSVPSQRASWQQESPFIRSVSLRHALKSTTVADFQMNVTAPGPVSSSSIFTSPLFNLASGRFPIVNQLSPFRSLQAQTCASEVMRCDKTHNQSDEVQGRQAGCDAHSQQLLSMMLSLTNTLGSIYTGDAIATIDSAGQILASRELLRSSLSSPSQQAIADHGITAIASSDSRLRVTRMAADELFSMYESCKETLSNNSIDEMFDLCRKKQCGTKRYTGYPNSIRTAQDNGFFADGMRHAERSTLSAFRSSFSQSDTLSKGATLGVSARWSASDAQSQAERDSASHALNAVRLEQVLSELSNNTAIIQILLHEKVSLMTAHVREVIAEGLLHTTRLVVWITVVSCVLIQLAALALYRLALFSNPDSMSFL